MISFMIQDRKDIFDSGLTRQQTEIALEKAWSGCNFSSKKNNQAGDT
jgi:hypothetical protein